MAVSMGFFVVDPDTGPVDENAIATVADPVALLNPEHAAGVEIMSGISEIVIRDNLDDLIEGLCIGGGEALATGGQYSNVSFAGFDTALIAADGETARFESGGDTLNAPRVECVDALRDLAGRYASLLERVFPDDVERRQRIAAFASG